MKKIRNASGNKIHDAGSIANMQYNEKSGAQKQVDVGPKLMPLPGGGTPTCDAFTAVQSIPAGKSLAIYNNSATLGTVAFGDSAAELATITAAGTVLANGQPVIPCKPNDWTIISAGEQTFVKTSATTLLVYLIDDETSIVTSSR